MAFSRYVYMTICLASIQLTFEPGVLHEIYDATFDMRPQFIGTVTQLEADMAEFEVDVFEITGTLEMLSTDTVNLSTKAQIDAASLTIVELLKSILLKLTTLA